MGKELTNKLEANLMNAGELTPISVKEARKVLGEASGYSSGESLAVAVLDFTAIARSYLRNLSKINSSNINLIGV